MNFTLSRVVVLFILSLMASFASAAEKRPNILFVLIDDMGYRDLGCFVGKRAKTPNIDRLAAEGLRFNQFYVSSPICSPSRTALTTGQYPNRWGITSYLDNRKANNDRGMKSWLDPSAPSLARMLHDAGYYTAHVGKWHMGGQRDVGDAPPITAYGFDRSITNFEGLGERLLPKWKDVKGKPFIHGPTKMSAELGGPITWVERYKVTEKFVDRAIEEMKVARQKGKPFYINLWPDDVHSPCEAPPGMRGDGSPAANYVGVLEELDKQIGRAVEFIRSNDDLRDNTLVLLCSDNGHEAGLGSGGELRGSKGQLYEGGIRSPLIAWWPGRIAQEKVGKANDTTVIAGIDFAPTVLGIVGAKTPSDVKFDGRDMSSVVLGKDESSRDTAVMWLRPPDRPGPKDRPFPDLAIREGNWKLLVARDGSRVELFDISKDPEEKTNIAGKHQGVVTELSRKVIEWDKSIGY